MYKPTDAQNERIKQAREFAQGLLRSHGRGKWKNDAGHALKLFQEYSAAGYHALLIPAGNGGDGLDYVTAGLIYEELSYHNVGFMPSLLSVVHCAELIKIASEEKQKERCLGQIASDRKIFGFCLTEEGAGSDIASIRCEVKESAGKLLLNGEKSVVINSAIADYFVVIATTNPSKGRAGINAFIVDAGAPGVEVDEDRLSYGFEASVISGVRFSNVALGKDSLMGEEGSGYFLLMETFDKGRPLVAASCVGAARRIFDLITSYAKQRVQFGKELFTFQGISFKLADFIARIHASQLLYLDALSLIDRGMAFTMEASIAKLYASETLRDLSAFGLELMGYHGFLDGNEVREIFHDAQLLISIDGSSNVQRMVIASQL